MNPTIEDLVMALRYAYYVKGEPLVNDRTYDETEKVARVFLPKTSKVHGVGSDREADYTELQKKLAKKL